MSSRTRFLVLVCALVGLGFSGASAWVHHSLLTDPSYSSFCDISSTFNCSQVYLSSYGSFRGVSTALGGVIWFTLVILLAGMNAPKPAEAKSKAPVDATGAYLFAWSIVGLAAVLYLAYASIFVLKVGCLLCIGTYVSVAAIFVLTATTSSVPLSAVPARLPRDVMRLVNRPAMLTIAILFLAGAGSLVAFFPKESVSRVPAAPAGTPTPAQAAPLDATQQWLKSWAEAPRTDLGIPADGAKVVIVKFNDYQCPGCRDGYNFYKPVIDKFNASSPGAIKQVTKDFPLEGECNFAVPNGNHFVACETAAAVRMANDAGKRDEMEAWVFANQAALTADLVKSQLTKIAGITNFAARYPQVLVGIRQDVSDGAALKLRGTPTYFVNGVRLDTLIAAQYFEMALQFELNKAAGK